jgi:hypothetical protein
MSYWGGGTGHTNAGGGTLQTGIATTAVTCTVSSAVAAGDLVVMALYATVNPGAAVDAGEGWVLLDSGFDAGNAYGMAIWAHISTRGGTSRNGLTLETAGDWAGITYSVHPIWPFQFSFVGAVGSQNCFNAVADSRSMSWNPFRAAGFAANTWQGMTILVAGCYNGATVPTATAPTLYYERVDTGIATTPFVNLWIGERAGGSTFATSIYDTVTNTTFYTTSGAQTKRASCRAFVPFIGNVNAYRGRYLSGRRVMG